MASGRVMTSSNYEPQGNQVISQINECIRDVVNAKQAFMTGLAKLFSANSMANDPAEMIARAMNVHSLKSIASRMVTMCSSCAPWSLHHSKKTSSS